MNTEAPNPLVPSAVLPTDYQEDERWLLVQRVLASPGFQRASQLRRILEYVTRAALLHPTVPLHEYEIACEVLGRRSNFDPTTDNIVRSQMSQLRRRLELYFSESPNEPLRMIIAKGSYLPQFQSAPSVQPAEVRPSAEAELIAPNPAAAVPWWRKRRHVAIAVTALLALACLSIWLWSSLDQRSLSAVSDRKRASSFVQFLKSKGSEVTIVLPDASLMLVERQLDASLTSQEYSSEAALTSKIARTPDPAMRSFLEAIRERRLVNLNEAISSVDLRDTLAKNDVKATLRFARDMHTRDFGEGNLILIGSRRSNPWTELFAPQTNFRFSEDSASRQYVYRNMEPVDGESATYQPYQKHEGKLSSYADVAFTANLTHSGYVLLINGSAYAANEAAIRYLLHGRLRDDLASLLRPDLSYFEVLLSGTHADNDAEESFEIVAVRPAGKHQ